MWVSRGFRLGGGTRLELFRLLAGLHIHQLQACLLPASSSLAARLHKCSAVGFIYFFIPKQQHSSKGREDRRSWPAAGARSSLKELGGVWDQMDGAQRRS